MTDTEMAGAAELAATWSEFEEEDALEALTDEGPQKCPRCRVVLVDTNIQLLKCFPSTEYHWRWVCGDCGAVHSADDVKAFNRLPPLEAA